MATPIYPIDTVHAAIADSNRRIIIDKVRYTERSGEVRKVDGRVVYRKRVTHNGSVQYIDAERPLRWDGSGTCFSRNSNVRQRRYDLPLAKIFNN